MGVNTFIIVVVSRKKGFFSPVKRTFVLYTSTNKKKSKKHKRVSMYMYIHILSLDVDVGLCVFRLRLFLVRVSVMYLIIQNNGSVNDKRITFIIHVYKLLSIYINETDM